MAEGDFEDRQAGLDVWKELAEGQFCFADAYSRDVIALIIANAIAQAREAGRRQGIAEAAKIAESWGAFYSSETRKIAAGQIQEGIRALLPAEETDGTD